MLHRLIALTTDFGQEDPYVGIMKGVILGRAPEARIVDLSHGIRPQDVGQAAEVVDNASRYFPAGTIHVVVVDPGVGSARRLLLVGARGQLFLAPDNGVLTPLLSAAECAFVHALECAHLYLAPVSRTFHGRDILAPVAAALANGMPPAEVGPALAPHIPVRLPQTRPEVAPDGRTICGTVMRVDHFGNLITNIHRTAVAALGRQAPTSTLVVRVGSHTITGPTVACYAEGAPGTPLALFDSNDHLEIAVNQGNASRLLTAAPGDTVIVSAG